MTDEIDTSKDAVEAWAKLLDGNHEYEAIGSDGWKAAEMLRALSARLKAAERDRDKAMRGQSALRATIENLNQRVCDDSQEIRDMRQDHEDYIAVLKSQLDAAEAERDKAVLALIDAAQPEEVTAKVPVDWQETVEALKDMASDFNRACDFPENRAALDALARIGTDQPERPEVTVGDAARVLLDMLNLADGVPKLTREETDRLWRNVQDAGGYLPVNAFLRTLAQGDTE